MGYLQMGIPRTLVLKMLAKESIPNFVETGTFQGGTTLWAAQHFNKVITIEINPEFSRAVAARPDCPKNIEFLVGDSAHLMSAVAAKLSGPTLFWLDGHYCGLGTGNPAAECPIMEELRALVGTLDPVVMIDDARCFLGPPPPPHEPSHWVSIDDLYRFFIEHFPNHTSTVFDDVIITVPKRYKPILDGDWLEHFDQRFGPPPPVKRSLIWRIIGKFLR
jgi:hypothetical protein